MVLVLSNSGHAQLASLQHAAQRRFTRTGRCQHWVRPFSTDVSFYHNCVISTVNYNTSKCAQQVKVQAIQTPVREPTDQEAANTIRTNYDVGDAEHFTTDIIEREKKYVSSTPMPIDQYICSHHLHQPVTADIFCKRTSDQISSSLMLRVQGCGMLMARST